MNTWTQENPHTGSRHLCVNLLAKTPDSTVSSSCPGGISVEINVTDSEANLPVGNSSVEVSQTQALLETEVIQGLTEQEGQIKLALQKPGNYLVQVLLTFSLFIPSISTKEKTNTLPGGGRWVLWRAKTVGGGLLSPLLRSLLSKTLLLTPQIRQ